METSNKFPVFRHVFPGFPISHVLLVQILPTPGGGRVPGTDGGLYSYAFLWRVVHGAARAVDLGAFSRVFAGVHDGVRVGEKERRGPDVLSGPVPLHGALSSLGVVGVLDGHGESTDHGRGGYLCRAFLLLAGVRLPEARGDSGVPVEAAAGRSFRVYAAVVPAAS